MDTLYFSFSIFTSLLENLQRKKTIVFLLSSLVTIFMNFFILQKVIYNTIFFHFLILVLKDPKGATVFT